MQALKQCRQIKTAMQFGVFIEHAEMEEALMGGEFSLVSKNGDRLPKI